MFPIPPTNLARLAGAREPVAVEESQHAGSATGSPGVLRPLAVPNGGRQAGPGPLTSAEGAGGLGLVNGTRQVLFVQGGGAGTHGEWDNLLVESLGRELGEGYEIRYPRMPSEDDPNADGWDPAIRREVETLDDGAVVVGHSVGAVVLLDGLARWPSVPELGAIVLLAAPFAGPGGWPSEELELPMDLGDRLPRGVPVHVFHGSDDETAPVAHAELYAQALPRAQVHVLAGRDHQLNNDLSEVAESIRAETAGPANRQERGRPTADGGG